MKHMHLHYFRRGTAIMAVAALPVALLAGEASATTKKSTSLSIRAAHSAVLPHTKDTISGVLKSGTSVLAAQKVTLEQRKYGTSKWAAVMSATTNSKGAVSFS